MQTLEILTTRQSNKVQTYRNLFSIGMKNLLRGTSFTNQKEKFILASQQTLEELIEADLRTSGCKFKLSSSLCKRGMTPLHNHVRRLSQPLFEEIQNGDQIFEGAASRQVALGLVGVHAVIWTPEQFSTPDARKIYQAAVSQLLGKSISPLYTLAAIASC